MLGHEATCPPVLFVVDALPPLPGSEGRALGRVSVVLGGHGRWWVGRSLGVLLECDDEFIGYSRKKEVLGAWLGRVYSARLSLHLFRAPWESHPHTMLTMR